MVLTTTEAVKRFVNPPPPADRTASGHGLAFGAVAVLFCRLLRRRQRVQLHNSCHKRRLRRVLGQIALDGPGEPQKNLRNFAKILATRESNILTADK